MTDKIWRLTTTFAILALITPLISFADEIKGMAAPALYLPKKSIDLGSAMQGAVAHGKFTIANRGSAPLEILELKSSCGCTVAELETKTIKPGEEVTVHVSIDTAGKVGQIRKSISIKSNDPASQDAKVGAYITVNIADHQVSSDAGAIFRGKCAECHFAPAGDLKGEPLFEAVCAMCHGHYGLGASAMRINDLKYLESYHKGATRKIIAGGGDKTSMPGFSKSKGGPLSDEQIDSIMELIEWWGEGFVFKKNGR